jgi:hypothetical protein
VLLIGGHDPRLTWIASHYQLAGPSPPFFCTSKDAPGARG